MWSRAVVARQAHNLKVGGSIPPSATNICIIIMKKFLIFLCLSLLVSCQIVDKETKTCIVDKIYYRPYTSTHFSKVGNVTVPRYTHHPERYELKLYSQELNKTFRKTVSKSQYDLLCIGDTIIYIYQVIEF